jgi:hypothetical protein
MTGLNGPMANMGDGCPPSCRPIAPALVLPREYQLFAEGVLFGLRAGILKFIAAQI